MNVNGSVTPVEFSIQANDTQVISITRIRLIFHSTQMDMSGIEARRFGAAAGIAGLPNGLEAFVEQDGEAPLFNEPVQHMSDFWTYTDGFINAIAAIAASVDFLSWDIDLPVPIVIPAGVTDRVFFRINDDLTPLDLFQVIVRGSVENL